MQAETCHRQRTQLSIDSKEPRTWQRHKALEYNESMRQGSRSLVLSVAEVNLVLFGSSSDHPWSADDWQETVISRLPNDKGAECGCCSDEPPSELGPLGPLGPLRPRPHARTRPQPQPQLRLRHGHGHRQG